ncbi:MAG: hypothetical protein ACK55I_40070 [bacterium]
MDRFFRLQLDHPGRLEHHSRNERHRSSRGRAFQHDDGFVLADSDGHVV